MGQSGTNLAVLAVISLNQYMGDNGQTWFARVKLLATKSANIFFRTVDDRTDHEIADRDTIRLFDCIAFVGRRILKTGSISES